jgi:hypothetical protein
MKTSTMIWILAAIAVWYFFLRSKPAAAMMPQTQIGYNASIPGTSRPASAGSSLTAMPSLQQMAGWGGQTFTAMPSDTDSSGPTSFPGDDLMTLG